MPPATKHQHPHQHTSSARAVAPPPWDLALYTREYSRCHAEGVDAQRAWTDFLSARPLLYLPDRSPHGDCDARVEHGRQLWRQDELAAFHDVVAHRTEMLLRRQQAVLLHWYRAAMAIQAHARGLLGRRRVKRMREQLREATLAAQRARELAALRSRQLHAAVRIQTVYHRHCAHLHFVFACRERLRRSLKLYTFRWRRQRAARRLQRAFRQYRRRVRLWNALRTVFRLLRRSRQREQLVATAAAFHRARREALARERRSQWTRHPLEMAQAARVRDRKTQLLQRQQQQTTLAARRAHAMLPPVVVATASSCSPVAPSIGRNQRVDATALPRLTLSVNKTNAW